MNRRDLLLHEMGITQWELYRPEVLKGAVNLPVSQHIQLIIISTEELNKNEKLIQDLLHSIDIPHQNCLTITFDFAPYLNIQHSVNYWLLTENKQKIDRTLPYCKHSLAQWHSPNLSKLQQNPQAKKHLWQQIQTKNN